MKFFGVLVCSFTWDCAFDHGVAVADQVIAEVSVLMVGPSGEELVGWVCCWYVLNHRRR